MPEQSDGREVLVRAFGLALSLPLALGHRCRYPIQRSRKLQQWLVLAHLQENASAALAQT
jgi:hypothetical protein